MVVAVICEVIIVGEPFFSLSTAQVQAALVVSLNVNCLDKMPARPMIDIKTSNTSQGKESRE